MVTFLMVKAGGETRESGFDRRKKQTRVCSFVKQNISVVVSAKSRTKTKKRLA